MKGVNVAFLIAVLLLPVALRAEEALEVTSVVNETSPSESEMSPEEAATSEAVEILESLGDGGEAGQSEPSDSAPDTLPAAPSSAPPDEEMRDTALPITFLPEPVEVLSDTLVTRDIPLFERGAVTLVTSQNVFALSEPVVFTFEYVATSSDGEKTKEDSSFISAVADAITTAVDAGVEMVRDTAEGVVDVVQTVIEAMDFMSETAVEYVTGTDVKDQIQEELGALAPEEGESVSESALGESTPASFSEDAAALDSSASASPEESGTGTATITQNVLSSDDVMVPGTALTLATTTLIVSPLAIDGVPLTALFEEVAGGFAVTISPRDLTIGAHTVTFSFGDQVFETSFTFGGDIISSLPLDADNIVFIVRESSGAEVLWLRERAGDLVSFTRLADESTMRRDSPLSAEASTLLWLAPDSGAFNAYDTVARTHFSQSLERRGVSEATINGEKYDIDVVAGDIEIERSTSE